MFERVRAGHILPQGVVYTLFAPEVLDDQRPTDTGPVSDVIHGRARESLLCAQSPGHLKYLLPPLLAWHLHLGTPGYNML
jgi:hypothetical protein